MLINEHEFYNFKDETPLPFEYPSIVQYEVPRIDQTRVMILPAATRLIALILIAFETHLLVIYIRVYTGP